MGFRSLLAPLLLPLLFGAAARTSVPALHPLDPDVATISAVDALAADPALPVVPVANAPAADASGTLRLPGRGDAATAVEASQPARTARAAILERRYLDYARALSRARRSLPATCCNPPPITL